MLDLQDLPVITDAYLQEKEQHLLTLRQELRSINESNAVRESNARRASKLASTLEDLKARLPENLDITDLQDTTELARLIEAQISEVATIRAAAKQAKVNNEKVAKMQIELAQVVKELAGLPSEPIPIDGVRDDFEKAKIAMSEAVQYLDLTAPLLNSESQQLARKSQLLMDNAETLGRFKAIAATEDDYRYIYQLVSNSRELLVDEAFDIVFGVASQFVGLCSDGEISRVVMDDGIRYVENGRTWAKNSASGAQKSLIGLGMKLGLANLVACPFSALLLDEATADMSQEISMRVAMAMETMTEQYISISHRQMDTAGNVLELA